MRHKCRWFFLPLVSTMTIRMDPEKGFLSVIFFIIVALLACNRSEKGSHDLTVFRYNEAAGITSLDPAYSRNLSNIWACNQLFNGLVELDDSLMIKPSIAKSWEISEDGTSYHFHLRNDVYFHDHTSFSDGKGRKVKASDFQYSFRRIADPATASPGSWVFSSVVDPLGEGFHAPDDSTFTIKLKKPFPPFLGILTMKYCSVVPFEIVDALGKDFRMAPSGTGPFQFKYWKEGVKLVFRKNPVYFERDLEGEPLPYLDAVSITFLMDKQSAFLEFVKGNLDFISGMDPSYKDELLTPDGQLNPKYRSRFYLIKEPYLNTEYLGFLLDEKKTSENNPLLDLRIRKAINYGFDRKHMIRYLKNNIGTPGLYGMIPPGLPSFQKNMMFGYDYQPDSTRKLLADAGYPYGEGLPDIHLATTSDYLDLCRFIQHQLGELGINIRISVNPPATNAQLVGTSRLDFFRASWIADYPDAENYLSLFYGKNFSPAGPNYTHFSNSEFDALYLKAQRTFINEDRYELYRKMNNLTMREAPVVILYYDEVLRFISRKFTGLGSNPINLLDLREVKYCQ